MIGTLRKFYRTHIHSPALDRAIYTILDSLTALLAKFYGFSFPDNYIRRWKLNMVWGIYEKETYDLFKRIIKPGMVVVDVGAHIGYFTRLFSKLVGNRGKIYAFEPDPENFGLLEKNTRRLKNVTTCKAAVSYAKKTMNFYRSEKTGCHSLVPDEARQREVISVESVELDAFLVEKGETRVDLIKMDIEGGEMGAIRGARKTLSAPSICLVVEWNPSCPTQAGFSQDALFRELSSLGFKIFAIQKDTLLPVDPNSKNLPAELLRETDFVNLFCMKQDLPS